MPDSREIKSKKDTVYTIPGKIFALIHLPVDDRHSEVDKYIKMTIDLIIVFQGSYSFKQL